MKAGTTWLYDQMKNHPQVYFCPEKELHYFAHQYGAESPLSVERRKRRAAVVLFRLMTGTAARSGKAEKHRHLIDWYLEYVTGDVGPAWFERLMAAGAGNQEFISDFSNLTCFLDEEAWARLRRDFGAVKVIYIMRDPIKRIWSHYKFHLQHTKHTDAERPGEKFDLFKRILGADFFIKNAQYFSTVTRLRKGLDESSLRILYFEDMTSQPLKFLAEVENFVGLTPFEYRTDRISVKKNVSIDVPMPVEWRDYARETLASELNGLKDIGLWHASWSS